jgi:hypothetical protein
MEDVLELYNAAAPGHGGGVRRLDAAATDR